MTYRGGMGGSRPTPYDRPGGRGGYGGYGRGFGAKYGSGYERGHRGRGRGGDPGGPPPPGGPGFMPFDPYGGGGFFEDQEFYPPPGSFEEGSFPPPPGGGQNLVAYPPIRPSQPGQGGLAASKSKHVVRMRGLPFSAKEKDITDFFAPVVPARVSIDFDHYGRPSGEAEVQFGSHEDADAAMQKNNAHMGEYNNQCTHTLTCTCMYHQSSLLAFHNPSTYLYYI